MNGPLMRSTRCFLSLEFAFMLVLCGALVFLAPQAQAQTLVQEVSLTAESLPDRVPTCRLGWLPGDWVAPFEPYGINESVLTVGLGTLVAATGGYLWMAVDWAALTATAGIAAALYILHLPLEMVLLGGGGIAAWEGAKEFMGADDASQESAAAAAAADVPSIQ